MLQKESNGMRWLEFELLSECKELAHGCFLRHGGMSEEPYTSLNLGLQVGDNSENVLKNLQNIKQALQLKDIFFANQNHGKTISHIQDPVAKTPLLCDALTTQLINTGLMITHADCQAAIFYDPIIKACAGVHSGWRGSVQNIYKETVQEMQRMYGSKPTNLLVCISPSLGPQSAEFIHYQTELPESFWKFRNKSSFFDFWKISRWQLEESGVLSSHIQIAEIDTLTNFQDYFSYRHSKICGRNATVCGLKS